MKAIVQYKYGSPDTLQLEEIEKPTPQENEVLVRVHAASLHLGDWHVMRGKPFLIRLMMGLSRPKIRPGTDIAGVVEAVGENVTSFTTGDEVLGWCTGGFAEYTCAEETNFVSRPADLAWEEASALITSAFTALQAVRDRAGVRPGQKVLVNGASGGVGTFTVQIAKAFGAEVTGVCSTRNVEMVAGLGADRVIDYTQEDFTRKDDKYDLILDVAGNRSLTEYRRVIKPTGKVVPIGGSPSLWRVFRIFLASLFIKQQEAPFVSTPNHDDLVTLKKLVESGKVNPVLDKIYPLAETAEAYRYIGKGRARAKVIVRITE